MKNMKYYKRMERREMKQTVQQVNWPKLAAEKQNQIAKLVNEIKALKQSLVDAQGEISWPKEAGRRKGEDMNKKKKTVLKVILFVTMPLWFLPWALWQLFDLIWQDMSSFIDWRF